MTLETFATRLIAAYLKEQVPVAWYRTVNGIKAGISWDRVNPDVEGWREFPLFTAPPEPAPQQEPLHVGDSQFESWFSTYWSASLRNGSKQIARDAYAAGMGDPLVVPAACAAPSSEEVREMLARLNAVGNTSLEYAAADLIERLAARVDDLKQANDGLATAGILPDGCVVVPREPTDEMRSSYMNANREYWFEYDKLEAPIGKWCAGTVKQAFEVSYKSMIAAYKGPSNE